MLPARHVLLPAAGCYWLVRAAAGCCWLLPAACWPAAACLLPGSIKVAVQHLFFPLRAPPCIGQGQRIKIESCCLLPAAACRSCLLLAAACSCLLLAVAGCCWLLLAAAGCCWLPNAGCCWLLLPDAACQTRTAACCWLLLAGAGCCWLLLGCYLLPAACCCPAAAWQYKSSSCSTSSSLTRYPLASARVSELFLFFPGSCVINSFSLTHSPLRPAGVGGYISFEI